MTEASRPRALVADDEPSIRFVLREALETAGLDVVDVDNGDAALEALEEGSFEIAFFDVRMPGLSGLELLDRTKSLARDTAVVIITAQNTLENAVEAMKRGALDYLVKPFRLAEITALTEKARRTRALEREVRALRREVARRAAPGERLVGKSPVLLEIFKTIGKVARSDVPVLITGESGTGKELVARAIHAASGRVDGPFVAINAAAIPRELLESELFGHVKGAFTGAIAAKAGVLELAHGGTVLLDNVDELALDLQPKLLRFLEQRTLRRVGDGQTRDVDVRIVSTTQRGLELAVEERRLREDLYYRLAAVVLDVPSLAQRTEDIRDLARSFANGATLSPATLSALEAQPWPGNVRELRHAVERGLSSASWDVPIVVGAAERVDLKTARSKVSGAFEADALRSLLEKHKWNVAAVAREAKLARSHLYTLIQKHGLRRPR